MTFDSRRVVYMGDDRIVPVDRYEFGLLVIDAGGTGAYEGMRLTAQLGSQLAERGVVIEPSPTSEAVKRINELLRAVIDYWGGALQLTC